MSAPAARLIGPRGRRRVAASILLSASLVASSVLLAGWPVDGARSTLSTDPAGQLTDAGQPGSAERSDAEAASWRQARDSAIRQALKTMNRALASGDERAFLSVVDPRAPVMRQRAKSTFRALRAAPLQQVRYSWPDQPALYVDDVEVKYQGKALVAAVTRQYRLPGWDPAMVREAVGLTFRPRGERWYLVSDTDADEVLPRGAHSEPWAAGSTIAIRRPRVLVFGQRSHGRALERVADAAEEAIGEVRELWRHPDWNGKAVIYAHTNRRFLDSWFDGWAIAGVRSSGEKGSAIFEAVVGDVPHQAQIGQGEDAAPAGVRMVLSPGLLNNRDTGHLREMLLHELTHVALRRIGDGAGAVWVDEGAAEYTANRVLRRDGGVDGVTALSRRGLPRAMWDALKKKSYRPVLPIKHHDFYGGSQYEVGVRYSDAWFAMLYIADEHGESAMRRFVLRALDTPDAKRARSAEGRALQQVLGLSRSELSAGVRQHAKQLRSRFV